MLRTPPSPDKESAPRDQDFSGAVGVVGGKDGRNVSRRAPLGADCSWGSEDLAVGELSGPTASRNQVPLGLLEEGNPARGLVMEEATLLIVEGGRVVEQPPRVPHHQGRRCCRHSTSVRSEKIGDGVCPTETSPSDARRGSTTVEHSPKGERGTQRGKPFRS